MAVQNKKKKKSKYSNSLFLSLLIVGIIAAIIKEPVFYIVLAFLLLIVILSLFCSKPLQTKDGPKSEVIDLDTITDSEWEVKWRERKSREVARKQQCDTFTVDDMQQFPDIPIAWSYIAELHHTDGIAWCQLNWNNQQIVLHYISQINDIIVDAQSYVDGIGDAQIDLYSMDFDYPVPMHMNSMCNTRIECYPYTATGKLSKYPVVIQFATKQNSSRIRTVGEIKILRDGNIGSATVGIRGNTFKIGLHGTSLVLKRIDNPYMGGNLFKFSETYD